MIDKKKKAIRLGLIGAGGMGRIHAQTILSGAIPRLQLSAVMDNNPDRLAEFPAHVQKFTDAAKLFHSGAVDAVLIVTPHITHPALSVAALQAGLHVLVEKPVAVQKLDVQRMLAAPREPSLVFAAMFNQRTNPNYQRIRELIRSGELGEVRRVQWTVTNWFRTQAYYDLGPWRATWRGQGGGVLLNQSPHQLDLLCWLFGSPQKVRAFCQFGRHHAIEVEDEVTAYLEFPNGATGVFITSTGEAPGTNRLEIAAERGRVILDGDNLSFTRNETPMTEFSRTHPDGFATPAAREVKLRTKGSGGQHTEIMQNFAAAILDGAPLLAPAEEGLNSVELANAMLLSTWLDRTVELPLDAALYARMLKRQITATPVVVPAGRKAKSPRR